MASHTAPNRGDVLDDRVGGPASNQDSGKVSTKSGPIAAARYPLSNWAPDSSCWCYLGMKAVTTLEYLPI